MKKDHAVDAMTRSDFEQLFEDHTGRVVGAVDNLETKMDKGFQEAKEDRDDLRSLINAIDTRTEEDTTATMSDTATALKKIAVFEKELAKLKEQLIHA